MKRRGDSGAAFDLVCHGVHDWDVAGATIEGYFERPDGTGSANYVDIRHASAVPSAALNG